MYLKLNLSFKFSLSPCISHIPKAMIPSTEWTLVHCTLLPHKRSSILLFHLFHSILSLPVRLSIKRSSNVHDAQASFINFSIPNGLLSLAASSKWCKLTESEGQYYTIVTCQTNTGLQLAHMRYTF